MKALVTGAMASRSGVVWNGKYYDAEQGWHEGREAPLVKFDAGPEHGGVVQVLPTLAEARFRHYVAAQSGGALYEVIEERDGQLLVTPEVPRSKRWTMARPVADFDRIFRRRIMDESAHVKALMPELGTEKTRRFSPNAVVDAITAELTGSAPVPWQEIRVRCDSITSRDDLTTTLVTPDGEEYHWLPPMIVDQWFRRLRAITYGYPHGAWYRADYVLKRGERPTLAFDMQSEPDWRSFRDNMFEFARLDFSDDFVQFPRHRDSMPPWYLEAAIELQRTELPRRVIDEGPSYYAPDMALARLWDAIGADGKPVVYRTPVIPAEKEALLEYLNNGHVVLESRGLAPDVLAAGEPEKVPMVFHTDGKWVWPGAIAFYLEHYDIAPETSFLSHIRAQGWQLPARLSGPVKARALGVAVDAGEPEPGVAKDWGLAVDWVEAIVESFNIHPYYYSIGEPREQALCLVREGDQWAVYWLNNGSKQRYALFDTAEMAATYLNGYLSQYCQNMRQPPSGQ